MAKTSGEIEKEFIGSLKASTGNDLKGWLGIIKRTGIEKRNDIINWLKKDKEFGHMNASLLAGIYLNNGQPVYGSEKLLLENQFAKCEEMRPLFEALQKAIKEWDTSVQFVAKKTYVSITKQKEFAAINIKPKELRVGMDLGDKPFDDNVQKSKLTGPMPRISHMVVVSEEKQINSKLFGLLQKADERVNTGKN